MPAARLDRPDSGNAHAPGSRCVVVQADGRETARVHEALTRGASAIVVLCAVGAPLAAARARLRALDEALHETTAAFGAYVSRSATDGLAAWAASTVAPIGVDVQAPPPDLDDELIRAALHPSELSWFARQPQREFAFARLWAGKEAALKAFGIGLAWPPCRVAVWPMRAAWHAVPVAALGSAWLSHLDAPAGSPAVALAVALNAGFGAA
jgi:4'-phosphopantetheinyl transferase superfamily